MTPLKETLEVGEAPVSQATGRPKSDSGQLRSDAVSLDVPVKVHGSRVVEVIRGTTSHTEPFEEQTSTMIVFPLGGVLKMNTLVNVGQAIVLTNLKTRQDAICRVVKIRTNPNLHSYIEVEFSHPQPGYWGVHFPSDGPEPPKKPASPAPGAAGVTPTPPSPVVSVPVPKPEIPKIEVVKSETPRPPIAEKKVGPAAVVTPPVAPSIAVVRTRASEPSTVEASSFSLDQLCGNTAVAPITPPSSTEKIETPEPRWTDADNETESSVENETSAAPETSTFARFAASAAPARAAFGAGLDYNPLGTAAAEKGEGKGTNWMAIAACVGVLIAAAAGGGYYFLHKRSAVTPAVIASPLPPEPSILATAPSGPAAAAATPVDQARAQAAPSAPATAAPPPVVAHARQPEPVKTRIASSEPAAQPPAESSKPEPAKRNAATAVPDMFGALNAHPTTAVHSADGDSTAAAPAVGGSALPGGQGIALSLSEATPSNLAPPPPSPQAGPEGPVMVGGDVKPPQLISSVAVEYPEIARQAGVQGSVVVRILIDKTGSVTEAHALSGPILLRDSAVKALRQRKYAPSKLDGHPISVEMLVTIQFRR
jgi:periplasmic protein TonB